MPVSDDFIELLAGGGPDLHFRRDGVSAGPLRRAQHLHGRSEGQHPTDDTGAVANEVTLRAMPFAQPAEELQVFARRFRHVNFIQEASGGVKS